MKNQYTEIEKIVEDDICASRHGGNEQSKQANRRNKHHRTAQRMKVLELIKDSPNGLSMKEVAAAMETQFSSVSGRGSELKKYGLVEETGEIRAGSAVLQATTRVFQPIVVTREQPAPEPRESAPIKPLTPLQFRKEMDELEYLYEHTPHLSSDDYDRLKDRLHQGLIAWLGE